MASISEVVSGSPCAGVGKVVERLVRMAGFAVPGLAKRAFSRPKTRPRGSKVMAFGKLRKWLLGSTLGRSGEGIRGVKTPKMYQICNSGFLVYFGTARDIAKRPFSRPKTRPRDSKFWMFH